MLNEHTDHACLGVETTSSLSSVSSQHLPTANTSLRRSSPTPKQRFLGSLPQQ